MTLLTKIQTLLHEWFPNKTDDRNNFDTWSDEWIQYENGEFYIGKDLTTYLNNTTNYTYATGDSSKLTKDTSDNSVKFNSVVMALKNEKFCETNYYTLEFDWKLSKGYDGGVMLGTPTNYLSFTQQTSNFPIQHGNMTSEGYYNENQNNSSSKRFSNYVHVIIIRNGNTFTIDVNNKDIYLTYTPSNYIENKFGARCWSSGISYIKNLKVILGG